MNGLVKFGLVAVGYVVAFVIAGAALAVRFANTSGPDAQASGGCMPSETGASSLPSSALRLSCASDAAAGSR